MPLGAEMPQKKKKYAQKKIPTRIIGRLGVELPVVGFPGISLCGEKFADPAEASKAVASAVERGAYYFDVAPEYGDGLAQDRLGPALAPFRDQCFLACKTMFRDAAGARKELEESLQALQTSYFDLYQLHSVTTAEDVDTATQPADSATRRRSLSNRPCTRPHTCAPHHARGRRVVR